jgi:FAD/FMN-containing dehydrogenase
MRDVRGGVIRPGDAPYDRARVLYNTRFDDVRPQAIARCASADEVRAAVAFAKRYALPLAVRSGGHSYGGWSTGPGLVIDTAPLAAVSVGAGTVTVGAGARLVDVYAALAAAGVGIAAGSCPTVGIAGLTLGGGLGVLSRAWGLTCDSLVSADIVTADGRVLTCDERREPELFWALRGAGMGSFGVVTSLVLRTQPVTSLALGSLEFPWSLASGVVSAWQSWIAKGPDALWSNVHLEAVPGATPSIRVHATYLGDRKDLDAQFDTLLGVTGAPTDRSSTNISYAAAMLLEAGCFGKTVAQCHLKGQTPEAQLERETYAGKSLVIPVALDAARVSALVGGMDRLTQTANAGSGAVIIDALGGAVSRVAPDATAFPHRGALAVAQLIGSWAATASQATVDATNGWLRTYHGTLSGAVGGNAYANYADPDLADWSRAYYGANYARLQRVKAMYDPGEVFTFPQAIRPR